LDFAEQKPARIATQSGLCSRSVAGGNKRPKGAYFRFWAVVCLCSSDSLDDFLADDEDEPLVA
jgi:hypothetical protein